MNKYTVINPAQTQICVDLTTLSLKQNAAIVSIAATKFTLTDGVLDSFIVNIDPITCRDIGLHIDKQTIEFWKSQPSEITDKWKNDQEPIKTALQQLSDFVGKSNCPVWANPSYFDLIILENAYNSVEYKNPFFRMHWNCISTLSHLFPDVELELSSKYDSETTVLDQTNYILNLLK